MLIEQYIVDVRRQHTGESLAATRRRLGELRDWSEPLPVAKADDQARLESHLLQALGEGQGHHPLGISEVAPYADHLVLRLESAQPLASLLPLLPYRDRRKSRHGVLDLRAFTGRRGIELLLGMTGAGRVTLLGPQGCDLAAALEAHREAVEGRQDVPLWTKDTPHDPMPRPWRRSRTTQTRSKAAKPVDPHAVRPRLASALLRRLYLWESMATGSKVTFTSEPHGSGLMWTVQRCLTQHARLHDDNVATALAESVAGPGLTADLDGHLCSQRQCVQTFDSGSLTVETVYGEDARPARRPGRARAHVLATFLSERFPSADAGGDGRTGHVLQLIDPWGDGPLDTAEQLAAAWAHHGLNTLVLRVDSNRNQDRNATAAWQRARLTGGAGTMFKGEANYVHGDLEADITRARAAFDHIIMVKRHWVDLPLLAFSPLADDHLIVADGHFPRTTQSTTVHAGELQRRSIALTPAESAVAWLHQRLARIPFADVPLTGLLLRCAHDQLDPDSFDATVDMELARHGMPVLGRLPQPPRRGPHRTVLDHLPDEQRAFVIQQSTRIRKGLGPALADTTAFLAALREYAEF
ncbi:hypothetical protein OH768_47615 [Streptomyces sp. NBC_01622]|uniref:hypothetical protein n=1 Tax=Streptomyces sp. NBC_01622 TaxID=2975903 RepID=UPI00386CD9E9|nr:hypothetical protein OH768_47615 [Streptomyces sp. NBC_01622]